MWPAPASPDREVARAPLDEIEAGTEREEEVGAPAPAPPPRVWVRPLLFFFLAALVLYSVLFVYHAAHLAFSTGELNYAEST